MSPSDVDPLELASKRPDWCAKVPLTAGQKSALVLAALLVLACAALRPFAAARAFVLVSTVFYLLLTLYKLRLAAASARTSRPYSLSSDQPATCDMHLDAPPVYSILVPMYKEPEVVPQMVAGLAALDYPPDRLDVQLLLEEDDAATIAAARATPMPPGFRVTVVPPSFPRTKPKACNIGLALARGEFLVIYDAEDRPDRDQLKKAVAAFRAAGPRVACVQSRLNFYNPRQNLLTRLFAGDYSSWFDLQLPGLSALGAVIPLGGTSNHFRTSVLRELLGWDAYNVTEDCDLGVRLCRAGYATAMMDSTTWEEACSSVPFWIRQRTRWIKGYIQTWFVHMRHPLRLLHDLGPRNFLHFQALVGGGTLAALLNPVFWTLALLWFLVHPAGLDRLFPGPVFAIGAFCLFAGNFLFVYVILLGCYRRNQDRLLWANLLSPLYWVLMSIAAWRALFQFFRNPFLWEKTQHALGSRGKGRSIPSTKDEVRRTKYEGPGLKSEGPSAKPLATSPAPGAPSSAPLHGSGCPAAPSSAPLHGSGCPAAPSSASLHNSGCPAVSSSAPLREGGCPAGARGSTPSAPADSPPRPLRIPAPSHRPPLLFRFPLLSIVIGYLVLAFLFLCVVPQPVFHAVREQVAAGTTCGRQAIVGSAWWAPLPLLLGALDDKLGLLIPGLLACAMVVCGLFWLATGRLRSLVWLAFLLAATLLCGIRAWGFAAVGATLLVLGVLVRRRRLFRLPSTLLLGVLPAAYSFLVWMLLNALILQDPLYFLRPATTLTKADVPVLFFGPLPDPRPRNPRGILADALATARARSPYARVFVCGYEGLGLLGDRKSFWPSQPSSDDGSSADAAPSAADAPLTPVLDLHLGELRKAYHGQVHFLLVKNPDGEGRFESHTLRHPGLYEFGTEGTLLAGDFGPWRLYELIATDGL